MGNTYTRYPSTSSGGVSTYANFASLPGTAADGTLAVTLDTHNLYVYNQALGGWQLESTGGTTVTQMGTFNSLPANANGGVVGSNSLYLQAATAVFPGAVSSNSQTFAGVKSLTSQTLFSDGTVNAPAMSFINEPTSGWYRAGTAAVGLSLQNNVILEALTIGSNTNFGFGGAASGSNGNAFNANYTINGQAVFAYANLSQGTNASTVFYIGAGSSGANPITLENSAFQSGLYSSGGGLLSASSNLSFLNLCSEISTGYITMNVGGRNLPSEKARFNLSNLTLNGGVSLILTGTSSGAATITQMGPASGTGYSITWPTAQGANNQTLFNNASGVLSWGSVNLSTNVIGSISLTGQVLGVLPLANMSAIPLNSLVSTTGSVSLTSQVSGILPAINTQPLSSITGSVSLTAQVSGNLPISQTSGSISYTQLQKYPSFTIGSMTLTSSTSSGQNAFAFPGVNGTSGQVLSTTGSGSVGGGTYWATALTNPMTSSGDIIVGSSTGVPSRVALGTPKQVLSVSSGTTTGPISWQTLTAPTVQILTSGSQFFTPAGASFMRVTIVGGGGGGGGAASTGAGQCSAGCGGNSGATSLQYFSSPVATYPYVVGAGGPGVAGANGASGSTSSFSIVTAGGGAGGAFGAAATPTTPVFGSTLSTITAGGTNSSVVNGGGIGQISTLLSATQFLSGNGASSSLGPGGRGIQDGVGGTGGNGLGYGDGGGGASLGASSSAAPGGAGAPGLVIVEIWYQ